MPANSSGIMKTNFISKSGTSCVQFFYYINDNGNESNTLTISIANIYGQEIKYFVLTGDHKGSWYMAQTTIKEKAYVVISLLYYYCFILFHY